jgi:catechol 2,3-dioxygenase-like lactoylglutathione lyase family enzyme
MTQIIGLAEAAIYVTDLARAAAFYTEVLGLPKTAEFDDAVFLQTGQDSTLILFDIESLQDRVSVIPGHGARGQGHIALAVPASDMDAWRDRLEQHQVPIEHEQQWPHGTHSIYFRDPDNNSIELIDETHYRLVWKELGQQG